MTLTELQNLLRSLGNTPEAIRDTLQAQSITGKSGNPHSCPVARYLQKHGASEKCSVGAAYIFPNAALDEPDADVAVATPGHIYNFICQFDAGHYPELREP